MKWIRSISIRMKLLIGFSVIILLMFLTLLFLNQWLLDDYFFYMNEKDMTQATEFIQDTDGNTSTREIINRVNRETGGLTSILDLGKEANVSEQTPGNRPMPPSDDLMEMITKMVSEDQAYSFRVTGADEFREQQILYIRQMDDSQYLIIEKGLGLVDESRRLFVLFLSLSMILVYMMGAVLIYLYAERFTRPIIDLKVSAEKMAALEFGDTVKAQSEDEIGDLVHSVNGMALVLSTAIDDLNTSNKLLERELNKERSLERMRRRFITDVSHELKNPISMIIGYADGIERGIAGTNEDKVYYAGVIKDEGQRMNRLICDLLDISSYESGTFAMTMGDFDLAELVYSSLGKYTDRAVSSRVTVTASGEGTLVVRGDRNRMEQVVLNLMDNAFKHVEDGGEVSVNVDTVEGSTLFTISNSGDLIPEKELERIWESFYQVDTDAKGNGLGLTIVKNIVSLHGGRVEVAVDAGMNVFRVRL